MGQDSSIEWTDATWNPVRGCTRVSEGCRNCYAEGVAARFSGPGLAYEGLALRTANGPRWTGKIQLVENALELPLRWKKPRKIFVNSMSDLFHPDVPFDFIDKVFAIMALAPRHTFQILTKRPERMAEYFHKWATRHKWGAAARSFVDEPNLIHAVGDVGCVETVCNCAFPLPNVWLGTSVENQKAADERIPALLGVPAAVRFLSCEPLLGEVRLDWLGPDGEVTAGLNALTGEQRGSHETPEISSWLDSRIDWVIAGGESGTNARPMEIEWARNLKNQCKAASVPFFMKQLGGVRHKRHSLEDFPEDLRVREFPG